MGEEVVSSYLWRKFMSILEEAEADSGGQSLIISRFRSIARQIKSDSSIPADELYDLIQALFDCRVFTYQRRTPRKGFYFPALIKLYHPLSELMFKMRMRKRLDTIEKKLLTPRVGGSSPPERPVIQQTSPILDPRLIIGFDEEAKKIEARLMASTEEDDAVTGIGLVGRCGCGKTALAQKVFASPKVVREFSPRIWVCLSNLLFDPKLGVGVVNYMLDEIEPSRKSDSDDSLVKLLEELHNRLMGKRYLIVLDDAWRTDEWYADLGGDRDSGTAELLSDGLPKWSGGAVIVTSRRESVIVTMVGDQHVFRLGPYLSDDVCWRIFFTVVQQQGKMEITDPKLSDIEVDAKRSFDGLPLLAKTSGNLLPDLLVQQEVPVSKTFLSSAIQILLQKLYSHEIKTFTNQERAESHFERLRHNLSTIQAVLDDAEEKQLTQMSVNLWLVSLRDLVYELEDVLDVITTQVLVQHSKRTQQSRASVVWKLIQASRSFAVGAVVSNYKMMSRIKEIANWLQFLVEEKDEFGLVEHSIGPSYRPSLRSVITSLVNESKVYGRDEDKEAITKMLLMGEKCHDSVSVIPIVGMGGIGKTTLAQLVYNDRNVKKNFHVRAWVYVSLNFDVISITKALYELVTGEPCQSKDFNSLQVRLKEELENRKFLIVLDDVWNEDYEKWVDLCRPFQFATAGSIIIVTTRNINVASMVGFRSTAYHMKLLSDDVCLSLLALHAGRSIHDNPELEEVGCVLVDRCYGLPLAVKALGGLLRFKESKEEWLAVLESKMLDISSVLKLSYQNLPSHLKQLFAYCSIFPRGYKFMKNELVYLWMGEGFLENLNEKESEEEHGLECFNELLSRSFFQRSSYTDKYFVMHDLMNDLAQFVAGSTCYRLDQKMDSYQKYTMPQKIRHISFLRHDNEVFTKLKAFCQVRGLRTLLPMPEPNSIFSPPFDLSNKILAELVQELHSLRVLSLSGYSITELPSSICNLIHLRFLDLSGTSIMTLPDTLGDIYNLRTLSLHNCRYLCMLPPTIGKLSNLRHLDNSDTDQLKEMPVEIGKLSNLQTLTKIVLSKAGGLGLRELRGFRQLTGSLSILELQNVANIEDAEDARLLTRELDELQLIWGSEMDQNRDRIDEEVIDLLRPSLRLKSLKIASYGGLNFPSWIGDSWFPELSSISILSCFECKSLPPLGQLPKLKHLLIGSMPNVKCISTEFYGSDVDVPFPKLKTLRIDDMPKWEKWTAFADGENISFPHLRKLTMSKCSRLTDVSPLKFPMLRDLGLEECSKFLVESFSNLDSLHSLKVGDIEGLSYLPKELTLSLSALKILECCSCSELQSLWPNETPLEHLTNLRRLVVADCDSLVSFGKGEQRFPRNLKHLEILRCNALESLPSNLSDFERLELKDCQSLRPRPSFP